MAANSFGTLFRVTSFGESHGPAIGGVIDGCPAGLQIDPEYIRMEMQRRKPGQSTITTDRKEEDEVEILSGVFDGITTGAPIGFIIRNRDQKSGDYDHLRDVYRPGHADFTYTAKYGHRDHRGSGRASARETAVRVFAGAIAKLILQDFNIRVTAYVSAVKDIKVPVNYTELDLSLTESNAIRCPHPHSAGQMIALIEQAKAGGDSVGGVITCICKNVPAGLGEPVFDKINALLAHAVMSINAVKGFETGDGFSSTLRYGSDNNDSIREGTVSNHDGGIQGGITNGKDIVTHTAFKPVSTISKAQTTLNKDGAEVTLEAKGRHDPCVLPRAVPIVEAMTAIVIADMMMIQNAQQIHKTKH